MFHTNFNYLANSRQKELEIKKRFIRKAFHAYSSDHNKLKLNKTDFKCSWLYLFGYKISKYELQEYFESLGKDYYKDGVEYFDFEKKVLQDLKRTDSIEELRNAFIAIDFSCKGFLTIDDMKKQFQLIAPHISQNTILDVFRYVIKLLCLLD
jgi:Ca2+-binding EF-hand superfamily protein